MKKFFIILLLVFMLFSTLLSSCNTNNVASSTPVDEVSDNSKAASSVTDTLVSEEESQISQNTTSGTSNVAGDNETSDNETSDEETIFAPEPLIPTISLEPKVWDQRYENQYRLTVELFRAMTNVSNGKNLLISPLSIQLALAMTANGANGKTLSEMETLLGGEMDIQELNAFLKEYAENLPVSIKHKLNIANSIWYYDGEIAVEDSFLKTTEDYYSAQVYKADFADPKTVEDINNWVNRYTDGMINKIIDEISASAVMYLINAISFDAEWQTVYSLDNVYKSTFTNLNSEQREVDMMFSKEGVYLQDVNAKGFLKYYKGRRYAFVALLPDEDVGIYEYIESLDPKRLKGILDNATIMTGNVRMPKFSYAYELNMNSVLKDLGIPTAFDPEKADLSALGSAEGNLYIGNVLHKTFIQVDELGTKAGAVTSVEVQTESAPDKIFNITLDRPFVYMIIDCDNCMPIFIGTLVDIVE